MIPSERSNLVENSEKSTSFRSLLSFRHLRDPTTVSPPKPAAEKSPRPPPPRKRLTDAEHLVLLLWMEHRPNFEKCFGMTKSTKVGMKQYSKLAGFRLLSDHLKRQTHGRLILTGEQVRDRWKYYSGRYVKARDYANSAGAGLNAADLKRSYHPCREARPAMSLVPQDGPPPRDACQLHAALSCPVHSRPSVLSEDEDEDEEEEEEEQEEDEDEGDEEEMRATYGERERGGRAGRWNCAGRRAPLTVTYDLELESDCTEEEDEDEGNDDELTENEDRTASIVAGAIKAAPREKRKSAQENTPPRTTSKKLKVKGDPRKLPLLLVDENQEVGSAASRNIMASAFQDVRESMARAIKRTEGAKLEFEKVKWAGQAAAADTASEY
ncbi:hypothetical protein BDK51DRAFT_49130 [Blyttiomyces helicus]|uniref:Myb/SANT-like domain-containing protein n=1 Tax=Blyttiomyces helicus TaxID=388810 RepID=A0A4P9W783_9FUNG|nr:hypothetical protein BDK51DRAFT_49130 [Blyttiomyces helicus]|eukprot:RKO86620.1 hypothetical protein BDK51DRAFT_49130 [Blyttiomyces helicus]